jgi:hypothetical protein
VAALAAVAPSVATAVPAHELYADACAGCHGADGRGAPRGSGITVPLPDFTDCAVVTGETTANWVGLVRFGGRFLGLSDQMPAFRDVLSDAEIRAVVDYLRTFCATPGYPLGDLNFPRPVFVEKAFPEDEAVGAATYASARHERVATWETAIEKRVGARGQVEVAVPGAVVDPDASRRLAGLGDVELSYKHALVAAPSWGTIVSARLALDVPTGNHRHGVGAGTPVVVPELLSGHGVGPFVLQTAIAAELPGDETRAERQVVYAAAVQYRLGPYRKDVVVGAEVEQTQALDSAVDASTVLGPSLYLPLSRRGHVALGIAAQLPVAGTRPYDWLVGSFILWDYADGPFWAW